MDSGTAAPPPPTGAPGPCPDYEGEETSGQRSGLMNFETILAKQLGLSR